MKTGEISHCGCVLRKRPEHWKSWKRVVIIWFMYTVLFIKMADGNVQPQQTCAGSRDCSEDSCCAADGHGTLGRCEKRLQFNAPCHTYNTKYIFLLGGGIGLNACGCQFGLICTRMVRKHWKSKKRMWSLQKKLRKTKYRYRCRHMPKEPNEIIE